MAASGVGRESLLQVIRELSSGFGIERSEQELAEHFVATVGRLLRGQCVAVRLVQSGSLEHVAAASSSAALQIELKAAPLCLGRAQWNKLPAACRPCPGPRLQVQRTYQRIFAETAAGFVIPLTGRDGQLIGVLHVEGRGRLQQAQRIAPLCAELLAHAVSDRRLAWDTGFLRERLARLFDHANALVYVTDAERRVLVFNRAMAELTGYAADEVLHGDVLKLVPPARQAEFLRQLERTLDGEGVSGYEQVLCRRDGSTVHAVFSMSRPTDPVDMGAEVVAIGQDVTALRLLEGQVIRADKLASLGQLAAGVVHEINNPLTSITVYADYLIKKLKREGCDAADVSMLEKILEGSNRILRVARDLVDYGKPTGDQLDVVSLNDIVQQSISFCEHVLERYRARLQVDLAPDLPPLYGVKDQLQQVMINLLTNACHALGEKGGKLLVRTWDGEEGQVALEVRDTGHGIPGENLPVIFEPFFTTKAPGEGTGLGLSIVKKIVDSHDGTILVESTVGKGTTFCIFLPTGHHDAG